MTGTRPPTQGDASLTARLVLHGDAPTHLGETAPCGGRCPCSMVSRIRSLAVWVNRGSFCLVPGCARCCAPGYLRRTSPEPSRLLSLFGSVRGVATLVVW